MFNNMASSSRCSARLRAKKTSSSERIEKMRRMRVKEKWSDEESESSSVELAATPGEENGDSSGSDSPDRIYSLNMKQMRDKNDFMKVYSSYNMDKQGDYYEEDFIDDSEYVYHHMRSTRKRQLSEAKKSKSVSKRVGVVKESDSGENEGNDGESSGDNVLTQKSHANKRAHFSSSGSESENEGKEKNNKHKRKRVRWSDSNEEEELGRTPSRSSGRAEKLRQQRDREGQEKLRQLKLEREGKKGILQEFHEDTSLFHPISNNPSGIGTFCSSSEETGSDSDDEEACDWIIPDEEGEEQGEADQQRLQDFTIQTSYQWMEWDLKDTTEKLLEQFTLELKKTACISITSPAEASKYMYIFRAVFTKITMEIDPYGLIALAMNMESVNRSLLDEVQSNPSSSSSFFLLAAGRADPDTFSHLLTPNIGMRNILSILSNANTSLLHLIIGAPWNQNESQTQSESLSKNSSSEEQINTSRNRNRTLEELDSDCWKCLSALSKCKNFMSIMKEGFHCRPNILELAVWNKRPKCTKLLFSHVNKAGFKWRVLSPPVDELLRESWPPTLLHMALYSCCLVPSDEGEGVSEGVASTVSVLIPFTVKAEVCQRDSQGNTPLLLAAQMDYCDVVSSLVNHCKASLQMTDNEGHTPLHLAAASGCLSCIKFLLDSSHEVDCRDHKGWPPLLYAHFSGNTECYLELMRAKPTQLSVLGDLLRNIDEDENENKRKTAKVVRVLLVSLAHSELYYNQFNDFIGGNLQLLDDQSFGFMKHCMSLLSFQNKQKWLRRKLLYLKQRTTIWSNNVEGIVLMSLPRQRLLQRVLELLWNVAAAEFWKHPIEVGFTDEAGTCTGPRREFWTCISRELANGEERVFQQCDDSQLCLQPCKVLFDHAQPGVLTHDQVSTHHHKLRVIGSLLAAVVFHGDTLDCNLSTLLTKQLLGKPVSPLDDLQDIDRQLYNQLMTLIKEDGSESLDLTFSTSVSLSTPWEGRIGMDSTNDQEEERRESVIDIPLVPHGFEYSVTDNNKDNYVKRLAEFKVEASIEHETAALLDGFWKIIPKRYLKLFTPNEFSLLLSGVSHIDVEEWRDNTRYVRLSEDQSQVSWFWKLVGDLSQQEKGLLLKFATGSPRLPPGGFENLMGLGGPNKFTLSLGEGLNKIPSAQTCFNLLILSQYSCEQELRDKVLIALRYGCEGFEFS